MKSGLRPDVKSTGPLQHTSGFLVGNACMLLASIFWGVNISVTKALIPEWMTAEGIIVVRLVLGAVLFWLASMFVKCERIDPHDWLRLISGGFIGLFGFIYLFVTSLRYGNPIDVSIIMTLPPMFVILIGVLFQKRRPSLLECVGVFVSFAGALIVILYGKGGVSGSDNFLGNLLATALRFAMLCIWLFLKNRAIHIALSPCCGGYSFFQRSRHSFLFPACSICLYLKRTVSHRGLKYHSYSFALPFLLISLSSLL